jgi:hypothetical protein
MHKFSYRWICAMPWIQAASNARTMKFEEKNHAFFWLFQFEEQ